MPAPGAVRNAVIARYKYDIPSLYPSLICCVFFSHLHSDPHDGFFGTGAYAVVAAK